MRILLIMSILLHMAHKTRNAGTRDTKPYNCRNMPLSYIDKARVFSATHHDDYPTLEAVMIECVRRGLNALLKEKRDSRKSID